MAVETGDYINDLNQAYPAESESVYDGDDHFRFIKKVLKQTFPGRTRPEGAMIEVTGASVTLTSTQRGAFLLLTQATSMTLPKLASDFSGYTYEFLTTNAVTLQGSGGDTVNGAASVSLSAGMRYRVGGISSTGWNAVSSVGVGTLPASAISFSPTGGISSTTVQAALAELDSEKLATSSLSATATPFTPAGTIGSTNVQAALQELDGDVQTKFPTAGGTISGALTVTGQLTANGGLIADADGILSNGAVYVGTSGTPGADAIGVQLSPGGGIEIYAAQPYVDYKASSIDYLWRTGVNSSSEYFMASISGGNLKVIDVGNNQAKLWLSGGYSSKRGMAYDAATSNPWNFYWTGGGLELWVDTSYVGTVTTSSDRRIKQNVKPVVEKLLPKAKKLKFYTYRHKQVGVFSDDGRERFGVMADEYQALFPELVHGEVGALTSNGQVQPQNIELMGTIFLSLRLIQELSEKLEQAEARIMALEEA